MSIKATHIKPLPREADRVPCKRCGLEIDSRPERSGYCASCTKVLRYDPDYFNNLPAGRASAIKERLAYKANNIKNLRPKTKAS